MNIISISIFFTKKKWLGGEGREGGGELVFLPLFGETAVVLERGSDGESDGERAPDERDAANAEPPNDLVLCERSELVLESYVEDKSRDHIFTSGQLVSKPWSHERNSGP